MEEFLGTGKTLKQRVADLETRVLNNEKERAHILTTLDEMKVANTKRIEKLSLQVEKLNTTVTGSMSDINNSLKNLTNAVLKNKGDRTC